MRHQNKCIFSQNANLEWLLLAFEATRFGGGKTKKSFAKSSYTTMPVSPGKRGSPSPRTDTPTHSAHTHTLVCRPSISVGSLSTRNKAAALKEAEELAAENTTRGVKFAEREAALKAKEKAKEDGKAAESNRCRSSSRSGGATQLTLLCCGGRGGCRCACCCALLLLPRPLLSPSMPPVPDKQSCSSVFLDTYRIQN